MRRPALAVAVLGLLGILAPAGGACQDTTDAEAEAFLDRVAATWTARDLPGWLALWNFTSEEQRRSEEDGARALFKANEAPLTYLRRPRTPPGATRLTADAQVFVVEEPRARAEHWRLTADKRSGRWELVSRAGSSQVEGLVHLTLDPRGRRADGRALRLEDFELQMEEGTLFQPPEETGATALVFVGRGRVRVSPRPAAERDQLRQLSGAPVLEVPVEWAFVRLYPADLTRLLDAVPRETDPEAGVRLATARRIFDERASRSYTLDASLPRSPWWLLPSYGDVLVEFPWKRRRVLTFVVSGPEAENLSLFDRDRRLQICSYPSVGRPTRYSEDDRRGADLLHQDLNVRFEPRTRGVIATQTLRLRMLAPSSTLRLRLHDDLRVISVTSEEGGSHLFLRVRGQGGIVVSLGPHAGRLDPFTLTVRYAGRHDPVPVEQEIIQGPSPPDMRFVDMDGSIETPLVYSNRTAWYARPGNDEFATARLTLDTPQEVLAVTGGELLAVRTAGDRVRAEYRLEQPGKFLTVALARFEDMGLRQEGEQAVRGFAQARTRGETLRAMVASQEMLAFYARLFGASPYPFVNLAVAAAETPGGHSPPGMVLLQQRPPIMEMRRLPDDPANFGDVPGFFLAHELAHQWWGQGVAPANYRERWLSEGWAQYAAALWVRESRGEAAFRGMMDRMARWAFRHTDKGPIHLGQRLGHLKEQPQVFRAVVYDKGAWILHMLRGLVGDEAFFRGGRAFLERHRYAKAGAEDLREALEASSGRDLRPYFDAWVDGTELPRLRWTSRTAETSGGFRTTVEVAPRGFPASLPLQIALITAEGSTVERVTVEPGGGSWDLNTAARPRRVELNGDRGLLLRVETGGP